MKITIKSNTLQVLEICVLFCGIFAAIPLRANNDMAASRIVSENFAMAMTATNYFIGVFTDGAANPNCIISMLPVGVPEDRMAIMSKWVLGPWCLDEHIKGNETPAYFIRGLLVRTRERYQKLLIRPPGSRWIFILAKIAMIDLVSDVSELSDTERGFLENSYYHLNYDATGAVCLHWPEESQFTPQDYVIFSTDEAVDDLKAIAAVYTPENGGENIPATDITTLENALETDFGRSVLTALLQLHGDPREE